MRAAVLALAAAAALLPAAAAQEAGSEGDPHRVVRGVTVSCQTWGREWGTPAMDVALGEVADLGANWVAIHPYARIHEDGAVTSRLLRAPAGAEPPEWLARPIRDAHARGLKVLVKPHLAYWGTRFAWRGEIAFAEPAAWERFFAGYRAWVLRLVTLCPDADAFCVGTELDRTLAHEEAWRELIAGVRGRTAAPLTYAANWTDYRRVGFWDALDAIGVQAYFPLVDHARLPEPAELDRAWGDLLGELEAFADRAGRPVVFTEIGYNRSTRAARTPWDYDQEAGPRALETQRRCLAAALRALARSDAVRGAFLWKWFPGEARGEDFLMSTPAMRAVIGGHWRGGR